jgi:hypothetical protein
MDVSALGSHGSVTLNLSRRRLDFFLLRPALP